MRAAVASLTDYTQAYKWYDIAAAIIGAKIDALPVAASHNGEKDNSDQLWYRDQVAKHMTADTNRRSPEVSPGMEASIGPATGFQPPTSALHRLLASAVRHHFSTLRP